MVTLTSTCGGPVGAPYFSKFFFAENRWWFFYSNGSYMCYSTNSARNCDSTSFNSPTIIQNNGTNITSTSAMEFDVVTDGTYVHYARCTNNSNYTYYRRGKLNPDGTITWTSNEVTVVSWTGSTMLFGSIALDSSGHVLIANCYNAYPCVFRNANTDGTWSHDSRYTSSGLKINGNLATSVQFRPCLVPLSDNKWACVFCGVTGGHIYLNWWDGNAIHYRPSSTPLQFTDVVASAQHRFSACADEFDSVYLAWNGSTSPYRVYFRKWIYGETTLSNSTVNMQNVSGYNSPPYYAIPCIRYDGYTKQLMYFIPCYPNTGAIYQRISGNYGYSWYPDPTQNGIAISTGNTCPSFESWCASSDAYGDVMVVLFPTNSGSPYNLKTTFATLTRYGMQAAFNSKQKMVSGCSVGGPGGCVMI